LPQHAFRGIDRTAHRRQCRVLMASAGDNVEQERSAARDMIAAGVRGLIIYPTVRQGITAAEDYLVTEDLGIPIVLIDTCTPEQGHAQVRFDNRRAGYQITQWLLDKGHESIGMIIYREETHHPSLEARLNGYLQAMKERVIHVPFELVQRIPIASKHERLDAALNELLGLEKPPTAIITAHDPMAVDVIQRLLNRGISVPEQVTVVGFDDNSQTRHFKPSFMTTRPDFESMGEIACDILLDAVDSGENPGQTYILPVTLVPRSEPSNNHV